MTQRNSPPEIEQGTLEALEWPAILEALRGRLATVQGEAAWAAFGPAPTLSATLDSLAVIGEMTRLIGERGLLDFAATHDLQPLLERARKQGRLEGVELMQVLQTQRACLALAGALRDPSAGQALAALAPGCQPEQALVESLGAALSEDGQLNETAFPELARLRRQLSRRRETIHKHLASILRSRNLAPALQEKIHTLRGGRYVVPVKADFRGQVPGIVHDVSASGVTLFVEPHSIVEEGNALTLAEKQIEIETGRLLDQLTLQVTEAEPVLRSNMEWLGRVDLIHAQALLSRDYGGQAPEVTADGRLDLRDAAHPLMLLDGAAPVRNDIVLGGEVRCMVISGANTGGKTVLLKTAGLCAMLASHGMPVPAARGSRCGLFADIRADIGDQQDLGQSLSTFSAQLAFAKDALARSGAGTLVLIDELLTGTAPEEGAALATALLERLADSGGLCIATTHYGELKELAAAHPRMVNASMAFDVEHLAPSFRLAVGTPGASYAFTIAERHGLDPRLVEQARGRLHERPAGNDALLAELHRKEQELLTRQAALENSESALARDRQSLAVRGKSLLEREWQVGRQEKGMVSDEVEAARRRIADVIKELQGANSLPLAGKVRSNLDRVAAELLEQAAPSGGPGQALRPEALASGDAVLVRSLNRTATFRDLLAKPGWARVELGALALEVELADLVLPSKSQPAESHNSKGTAREIPARTRPRGGTASPGPAGESSLRFVLPTGENTLDLRGMRLSAALEKAEVFCDQSVMKHVSPIVLIHGHGTGKLKAGIREWLRASPYVAEYRPGEGGEGRDGVTVVALNL